MIYEAMVLSDAPAVAVASASFGARRDFMLRCNDDKARKLRFPLGDGDVLIMSGTTQACPMLRIFIYCCLGFVSGSLATCHVSIPLHKVDWSIRHRVHSRRQVRLTACARVW
jgi:hypothetical protein